MKKVRDNILHLIMEISIRPLENHDLQALDSLLRLAFNSPVSRLHDLQLYRTIQPDGWFVATRQETPVGMVGAIKYGEFTQVGLMAVHPEAQRQGIGLSLMHYLLSKLDQEQVPLVTLDASVMGRPLYEKIGFLPYGETQVFQALSSNIQRVCPPGIQPICTQDLDELAEWDAVFFGANRRKVIQGLLADHPGRGFFNAG